MRRGVPHGYTIVEVMIFLSVSAVLFAMIALTFGVQRGRTQFQTAARELESRIRDTVNNTSSGFYQTNEGFTCNADSTGPTFSTPDAGQGSNQGCIFLGPAMRFIAGSNNYEVYTVAGLRREATENKEVENFDEANPRAVVGAGIEITDELTLPGGARLASMFYNNGGTDDVPIDGVGFFTSFGRYDAGALQPGSLSVNVVPLFPFPGSICASGDVVCEISALGAVANIEDYFNPSNGVTVCFDSGTSNQHGFLTIGGSNRQLTTDLVIRDGESSGDSQC